jgi:hypothetical protein
MSLQPRTARHAFCHPSARPNVTNPSLVLLGGSDFLRVRGGAREKIDEKKLRSSDILIRSENGLARLRFARVGQTS